MSERPEDPDGRLDIDARFADIVARFDEGVGERRGSTQGTEDSAPQARPTPRTPTSRPEPPEPADRAGQEHPASPPAPHPSPAPRRPAEDDAERTARIDREIETAVHGTDGGHYVPPDPEPLPETTPLNRLAWAAVLVGPLLLLLAATVWRDIPQWLVGTVVVAVVVGFVRLVWQLPRSGEGREDDGAQV